MARCARCIVGLCALLSIARADDRIHFNEEDERRWNTPPELTSQPVGRGATKVEGAPQPRFLPFSATFSVNAGANNAHSLSVGGSHDGISLSQSASQSDGLGSFGNAGSALSASQSSSFSAGLSGISAADSNSFNLNHPLFGGTSQANSNSFSLGEASASAHGSAEKGQSSSGAQSSVGSAQSSSSSSAGSNAGQGQTSSGATATSVRQSQGHRQSRPIWTNIGPDYDVAQNHHGRPAEGHQGARRPIPSRRPTRPLPGGWYETDGRRRPVHLHVGLGETNWQNRRPTDQWQHGQRAPGTYDGDRQNRNCRNNGWNVGSHRGAFDRKTAGYYDANSGCDNAVYDHGVRPGRHDDRDHRGQEQSRPGVQISAASASSGSSSTGNGFSLGQSSSQSGNGANGPSSSTLNHVLTSGDAQGFAQGASAALGQSNGGRNDASFSSGAISGNSQAGGQSTGTAVSGNRGQDSRGQVVGQSVGSGAVLGTANGGSVSFFPGQSEDRGQSVPREFIRSQPESRDEWTGRGRTKERDPIDAIITEITDTVADLFDV